MRFSLQDSPFSKIHKYHRDDVLDYLEPRLREFAWQNHNQKKAALPPCAFVFGEEQGSYILGFTHSTPASFIETVRYEARHLNAKRVLLLTEVNSIPAPGEAALLVVELQAPSEPPLRCAYDLLGPGRSPINDDWAIPSLDSEEFDHLQKLDPTARMLEEASHTSRLIGLSFFFQPVFSNPSDSAPRG